MTGTDALIWEFWFSVAFGITLLVVAILIFAYLFGLRIWGFSLDEYSRWVIRDTFRTFDLSDEEKKRLEAYRDIGMTLEDRELFERILARSGLNITLLDHVWGESRSEAIKLAFGDTLAMLGAFFRSRWGWWIPLLVYTPLLTYPLIFEGKGRWGASAAVVIVALALLAWQPIVIFAVKKLSGWERGFVMLKEGTAVFVLKGGVLHKTLMAWKGHTLDVNGNVEERDPGTHWLGGIRYFGSIVSSLFSIHRYDYRHATIDAEGKPDFLRGSGPYIPLIPRLLAVTAEDVEDAGSLRITLGMSLVARIVNPALAILQVGDWKKDSKDHGSSFNRSLASSRVSECPSERS